MKQNKEYEPYDPNRTNSNSINNIKHVHRRDNRTSESVSTNNFKSMISLTLASNNAKIPSKITTLAPYTGVVLGSREWVAKS
jgi:hypothetical protein